MRRLITTSASVKAMTYRHTFLSNKLTNDLSTIPSKLIQKALEYQFNFRTIIKFRDLHQYVMNEAQGIKKYGKTVLLEFLNEYPMQSFKRTREQSNFETRSEKKKIRNQMYMFLNDLEGLNFYEKNMRYSIFKKIIAYNGSDPKIEEKIIQYQTELLEMIKNQDLHFLDIVNWLYMLPIDYPTYFSKVAFDRLEKFFQNKQIRQYMKAQRALPMLIKRICELDWSELRKYKNINHFLVFEACLRSYESVDDISINLERICAMKLHTVGERVIPKIIDQMMDRLNNQFDSLTRNKTSLLKVFSCFNNMPINYNKFFFDRLHNYIKNINELSSHCLLMLPYNKLSQSEITHIQTKIFTSGRQDTASKLIYTIFKPYCKHVLTPLIVKQAYFNLLDLFKKENMNTMMNLQIYNALIFRFIKLKNPIINLKELKIIAQSIVYKLQIDNLDALNVFSLAGIVAFLEICHFFNLKPNYFKLLYKIQCVMQIRKTKNTIVIHSENLIEAIRVNIDCISPKAHQLIIRMMHQLIYEPEVSIKIKNQLFFLIEKYPKNDPQLASYSNQLFQQNFHDIESLVQYFIRYDFKTLKLTNFIFQKIAQKKVGLHIVLGLLASIQLKLVTSLKGKLISPLKKYLAQLEYSQFDVSKSNISTLTHGLRILFYFKEEIPEFMEHLSISLIKRIQEKINSNELVNGKQFTSLSIYVMEILANSDFKLKTQIIESIVSINRTLRKKQGIYMKVYELDFLCSHQKHIMINNQVLALHFSEVVQTLKKTERIELYKELFFIIVKLHCRNFFELNPFDLRYFTETCIQLVEDSLLNLSNLKQCLGYEILNCEDEFFKEKLKFYLVKPIKLAFNKDKRKHNFFMYDYFLKLFSKLDSTEMVAQICSKMLNEKLYPVEVSKIVPILNKNEIKNKKFMSRILNIIVLSDAYVTYERMQVLSWLQKIMYRLPQNDQNVKFIKFKIQLDISNKIAALKQNQRKILQDQERSIQEGFNVVDPEFDKNYKVFIDYAWCCLKCKNVQTSQFKYICRYLYFSIQKIRARIENPIERKQISKIKIYHMLKYLKECGFFVFNTQIFSANLKEQKVINEKQRKSQLLLKMESHLSLTKLQKCEKLEKKLQKMEVMSFSHKAEIKSKNKKGAHIAQYLVKQSSQQQIQKNNQFVILTVKKYHITAEIEVVQMEKEKREQRKTQKLQMTQDQRSGKYYQRVKQLQTQQVNNEFGNEENIEAEGQGLVEVAKDQGEFYIEESDLSLQMKPLKILAAEKQSFMMKQHKVTKPLFSSSNKAIKTEIKSKQQVTTKEHRSTENMLVEQKLFQTALKLETPSEKLYEDYNGYLKVQKSLVELVTGLKCIIYDPEKDIFFD